MNIQILSDRHEHVYMAIERTIKYLSAYEVKGDSNLLDATKQHYKNLLAEELRILKECKL